MGHAESVRAEVLTAILNIKVFWDLMCHYPVFAWLLFLDC
jgi:hypothetical protein